MLERVHPARPGWYEKLYATALDKGMASYEAEVYSSALLLIQLYQTQVSDVDTQVSDVLMGSVSNWTAN
jgi:hypothetical protein